MNTKSSNELFLLTWQNTGGDTGGVLFDRRLTPDEQYAYIQEVYGPCCPDIDVQDWIDWEFGPIRVTQWPKP